MWLLRHWKAVVGLLTLVPPVCKAFWEVVGIAGNIDFLITHAHDLGWIGDVISFFLNPPGWAILPLILIGLALIWWDVRRHRPLTALARTMAQPAISTPTPSVSAPKPTPPKVEAPQVKPAAEQSKKAEVKSRADTLPVLTRPRSASAVATAPLPDVPDWEWGKLYSRSEDGSLIHLRFLPDTEEAAKHTALLVVYGYKALMNLDSVRVGTVHSEIRRVQREAPNARGIQRMHGVYEVAAMLRDTDYGQPAIASGYLRRIRLSEGGAYELTTYGLHVARSTAWDLIERA